MNSIYKEQSTPCPTALSQLLRVTSFSSELEGKNYAYFAGSSNVFRYVWDGNNIALDENWGPVPYLKPGQTIAGALEIQGDWMILTTNGNPSNVPMSVVAISQANSSKVRTLDPYLLNQDSRVRIIPMVQWTLRITEFMRWMLEYRGGLQ